MRRSGLPGIIGNTAPSGPAPGSGILVHARWWRLERTTCHCAARRAAAARVAESSLLPCRRAWHRLVADLARSGLVSESQFTLADISLTVGRGETLVLCRISAVVIAGTELDRADQPRGADGTAASATRPSS